MSRYALLSYQTMNLGDDIQSLAAAQYLPRIDHHVDRDRLADLHFSEPTKIILNGWFLQAPTSFPWSLVPMRWRPKSRAYSWPPADCLNPLLTSVHVSASSRPHVFTPSGVEYLTAHGPVGCRDLGTLYAMSEHHVPAYFSGCLTMTLPALHRLRDEKIVMVDMPSDAPAPRGLDGHVVRVDHRVLPMRPQSRLDKARALLELYASARLVITTKLHAALPCRALGIPVLFVPSDFRDPRFAGLVEFLHAASLGDYLADNVNIDWKKPPPEESRFQDMAEKLRETCRDFCKKP